MTTAREAFHSSESAEWYTPPFILEAARRVMGRIDLDPASTASANEIVRATTFYDRQIDGLSQKWSGRVWLNPPYGRGKGHRSNMDLWSEKLISEYDDGAVEQACLLVKATPSEIWFQKLWRFPVCFTRGRLSFLNDLGLPVRGNAHGSAIVGIGTDLQLFIANFQMSGIGTVVRKEMDYS